ncbi:unnamed protein product [Brassica oleracea]
MARRRQAQSFICEVELGLIGVDGFRRDKGVLFKVQRSDCLAQPESGPAQHGLEVDGWIEGTEYVGEKPSTTSFSSFLQKPDYCKFAHLVSVFSETFPLTSQLSNGAEKSSCFHPKIPNLEL